MREFFLLLLLGMFFTAGAQEFRVAEIPLAPAENSSVLEISEGIVTFSFSVSAIFAEEVDIKGDKYINLSIPDYYNFASPGAPSLPVFSSLVEKNSPGNYDLILTHIDSVIIDLDDYFNNSSIMPAQPSLQKKEDEQEVKFWFNDSIYNSDDWIYLLLTDLEDEGRMRGVKIGRFIFNPVQYHPTENKIKVFYNISGQLVPENTIEEHGEIIESRVFKRALNSVIREEQPSVLKKVIRDKPMTLVILSDSMFSESLKPLVEWKRKKGFHVIEAYTDDPEVGKDREAIKTYLSGLYNTPPDGVEKPSYLLIAGDVEHVPLSQGSGQTTDLYYTCYDSVGDYLPELFSGRIAVKNEAELTAVIDKILEYEQYNFPDPEFLNKSILIAGYDRTHGYLEGNGQINYAANYYFNTAHDIDANVFFHPEASSSDAEILAAVSEGAALVNYTGHGEYYGWLDPAFRTGHVESLTNAHKYPLLIGNGCSTNVFDMDSSDCFAEAVVKAEGKGAIAYIGCTNVSYWEEDFYWAVGVGPITANPDYGSTSFGFYDKVFHDGAELLEEWSPSVGEMVFAGNMTVQQSSSVRKQYYWEIYQLLGDPTLVPWFTVPENLPITFPASLAPDASLVDVQASPYDYVAISSNGILLDAQHTGTLGEVSLSIPEEFRGDTILLVVTGEKRQPVFRQIPDVGIFDLVSIALVNESIAEDGILTNGEQAAFNIEICNVSVGASEESALIFSATDNIRIIDSLVTLPVVNPEDTILLENVFSFEVKDAVTDLSSAIMSFIRESDITSNSLSHTLLLHAPILKVKSFSVEDDIPGNGNGILEEGEDIQMNFEIENSGSFSSDSIIIAFAIADTIFPEKQILRGQKIDTGESVIFSADITIPALDEQSDFYLVPIDIGDGNYVLENLIMIIGKYMEDFSTDTLSCLPWITMDWQRDTVEYYYGPASLRSAEINDRQSTSASINVHTFEDDSIAFNFKVSSELGYDHLRFYVDGDEVKRWSGEYGWARYSHFLNSGFHNLEWKYIKDSNTKSGQDAAWIDNILFPSNAFIPDLSIDSIDIPRFGANLMNETLKLMLINYGMDTIDHFSVRFKNNDNAWTEVSIDSTILPGKIKEIEVPGTIDLSDVRKHFLQVVIRANEDSWHWNDTLSAEIDHYEYPDLSISYLNHDTANRAYVNLIALIENSGNIVIDDFKFVVTIDEEYSFSGKSTINLEPGSSTESSLNLVNEYYEWLETGWHDYHVELAEDSVAENNSVDGSIYWVETAVGLDLRSKIKLYPNPSSDILIIEAGRDIGFPCTVSITDELGREVMDSKISADKSPILLNGSLPSMGIFNIRIFDKEGVLVFTGKFIYSK